jgi:tellurite resistance protein TerA
MTSLAMGGNAPLNVDDFDISVQWKTSHPSIPEIDVAVFILTASGRVASDDDMVFYGQRSDKSGSVKLTETNRRNANGQSESSLTVDLRRLTATTEKIAVTATIMDAQQKNVAFRNVDSLKLIVSRAGSELLSFEVPVSDMSQAAIVAGEFYKRNGQWKFRANGQGFNGGLKPLAESFGVKIDDEPQTASPPTVAPTPPVPPTPTATPVNLSKVTLTKAQPKISLAKKGGSFGEIKVNLNWNKGAKNSGLLGAFQKGRGSIDLDLGCLFELQDGSKGAVQALGKSFGDFNREPFIQLMGDDRSGASADGEWLRINGAQWSRIKRIILYTFIYEGVSRWTETDGVVTVYVPDNAPIEIKLDGGASEYKNCAIVLLENKDGQISVTREVQYFRDTQAIDQKYSWGLRWVSGRK